MSAPWWWPFNALFWKVPSISCKHLLKRLNEKDGRPLLLVDVRSPGEYKSFHIEGAVSVPLGKLRESIPALVTKLNKLGKKESGTQETTSEPSSEPSATTLTPEGKHVEVVCICLSAHRSPPAVRLLQEHGINAKQLAFGMAAWRLGGYPFTTGAEPGIDEASTSDSSVAGCGEGACAADDANTSCPPKQDGVSSE